MECEYPVLLHYVASRTLKDPRSRSTPSMDRTSGRSSRDLKQRYAFTRLVYDCVIDITAVPIALARYSLITILRSLSLRVTLLDLTERTNLCLSCNPRVNHSEMTSSLRTLSNDTA